MAVPLLLLAVLEEYRGSEGEEDVDSCAGLAENLQNCLETRKENLPTMPNVPVKTRSRKLLPKVEKGPTQPPRLAATREFVQTLSTTNGGEVLFAYPQQLSFFMSANFQDLPRTRNVPLAGANFALMPVGNATRYPSSFLS